MTHYLQRVKTCLTERVRIPDATPLDKKLMGLMASEGESLFFVSVAIDRLSAPQWMTPCMGVHGCAWAALTKISDSGVIF